MTCSHEPGIADPDLKGEVGVIRGSTVMATRNYLLILCASVDRTFFYPAFWPQNQDNSIRLIPQNALLCYLVH